MIAGGSRRPGRPVGRISTVGIQTVRGSLGNYRSIASPSSEYARIRQPMRGADAVTGIFLGVLLSCLPAVAADSQAPAGAVSDAYLHGYVVSWLEQTMRLGPDRVS